MLFRSQEALGSVHYISPEQARGSHIDARSDIYSAGVVLYEMLTGRLPYEGDSPVAVAIQHINSIPLSPRELEPGIPEALESLKKQGAKLAVLSNKPHGNTIDVIRKVFGEGYFDLVQGQSELFPRKPAPDGALYLAERLGAAPGECLYVGDTGTDMKTGKAAGMYTIGVLWGFRGEEELLRDGADCIVSEAGELADIYGKEESGK